MNASPENEPKNDQSAIRWLLSEEGGCMSAGEIASRYPLRRSVANICHDIMARNLIAYHQSDGEYGIPVWQFDANGDLLPGMESALRMIRTEAPEYGQLFPFTFFLQADGRDPAMTPLEALRRGDVDRAMESLRSLIFG